MYKAGVSSESYISYTGNRIKYENSQEDLPAKADILKDLENLQIPFDVKHEASKIFRKLNVRTRGQKRKKILYYCLFFAYRKLNTVKDPKEICTLLGIKNMNTNKDFFYKFYLQLDKEQLSELKLNEEVKPEEFFDSILEKLSEKFVFLNSFCIPDIKRLLEQVRAKGRNIEEEFAPKIIAAGVVLYYLHRNGMYIETKSYAEHLGCSKIILDRFLNQLLEIL